MFMAYEYPICDVFHWFCKIARFFATEPELKNDKILPINVGIRQIKYLNNIIEQDHRSIKRIVNPMLGFQSFQSANKTLKGIEAMNMIKKGQIKNLNYSVLNEAKYINQLFGIVL